MKTDKDLKDDVLFELDFEPGVDASEIGVTTRDGVVSLNGAVKNYAEKYAAVQAVQRVAGIRAIVDELTVELPSLHARSDQDIAKAALNALEWDVSVPPESIKLKVNDGWITLEGEVESDHQRTAAEFAVRNLIGVTGITNLITLKKLPMSTSDAKTRIKNALQRGTHTDPGRIHVDVENQKVTLRGTVSSLAERQSAERVARSTPGVSIVVNDLEIAP